MEQKKIEIERLDLPFGEEMFESMEEVTYIKISCPSCSEVVPSSNIELESKIGKCSHCNALFSFKNELERLSEHAKSREKIVRPEGVEAFYFRNDLEIEINQPFPIIDTFVLTLLPLVFFVGIMIYFFKGVDSALVVSAISSLALVKSILRLVYRKRYKIYLTVNKDNIYVQHRPRPLRKDKEFATLDLDQIYVKQTIDGVGLFFVINSEKGQRHEQVLGRFRSAAQMKYIEQEIEGYLKIKDRSISGEV